MSPPKFHDGIISGPRPSSLRITKDSHLINKTASFDHSSSHAPGAKNHGGVLPSSNKRQPVIIYTHSPKVIHAQASDFMALVQKLTGLTRGNDKPAESIKDENSDKDSGGGIKNGVTAAGSEESESSCSVLTEMKQDSSSSSTTVASTAAMLGADQLFCSPTRSSNSVFIHQNSMSPMMDYLQGFPEY